MSLLIDYADKFCVYFGERCRGILSDLGCSIYVTVCYDFVKLTFIKWSTGCRRASHGLTEVPKGNRNRKVCYTQVWRKHTACLKGPQGEVKAEFGEREVGPGVRP